MSATFVLTFANAGQFENSSLHVEFSNEQRKKLYLCLPSPLKSVSSSPWENSVLYFSASHSDENGARSFSYNKLSTRVVKSLITCLSMQVNLAVLNVRRCPSSACCMPWVVHVGYNIVQYAHTFSKVLNFNVVCSSVFD